MPRSEPPSCANRKTAGTTDDGPVPDDQLSPAAAPASVPEGLELRRLRAFVAIAEELNFGRAAAGLFVSQSSLSRLIAALERMLGCVLMYRSAALIA
jgi:epsilon-lactone hydrolase